MLLGTIANSNRFNIDSVFNVHDRVSMFFGNTIGEMISLNKKAVLEDKIKEVSSFEDAAGTIPLVNRVQPVGLILDRSKKLIRGSELIVGTNISAFTIKGSGTKTSTNITTTAAESGVTRTLLTVGTWYEIDLSYTGTNTDEFSISTYNSVGELSKLIRVGEGRAIFRAEHTALYIKHSTSGTTTGITISLKEIPGNHLIQDTPSKRPVLTYRINRVNSSENLTDISWTNTAVLVEDEIEAPDGTLTAYGLKNTTGSLSKLTQSTSYFDSQNGQYYRTIIVKPGAAVGATIVFEGIGGPSLETYVGFNSITRNFTLSTHILDDYGYDELDDGWLFVWMKLTKTADEFVSNNIYIGSQIATGTQHEVIVWHPDTRLEINKSSRIPEYQATYPDETVDTVGFPPYLDSSGDKFMKAYITLASANRVMAISSFSAMSNDEASVYLEYGTDSDVDDGSFSIRIPETLNENSVILTSRGTAVKSSTNYFEGSLPKNFAVSAYSDLTFPELKLSVNGVDKPVVSSSQGSGSFSSRTLNLFGRNDSSLFGDYHVFMLPTIIFMNSSDPGLTAVEMRELKKIASSAVKI